MRLKSQRGHVIIQAAVVGAILSMAGVAALQIATNNKIFGETSIANQEMALLASHLRSLMRDERSCRATLVGQVINPALNVATPIRFRHQNGVDVLLSTTPPNNIFGKLTVTLLTLTPRRIIPIPPGALIGPGILYAMQLSIGTNKGTRNIFGSTDLLSNDIWASVRLDAGNAIVSCTGISMFGSDERELPVCGPGQGLYMGGPTGGAYQQGQIRCVQMVCPATTTPGGFDGNGIICTP